MNKLKLSIVIPIYNGEHTIEALFKEIKQFFDEKKDVYTFEVIMVHDCGKDNSWDVIERLQRSYPNDIKAIQLTRNYGQHNALICGFKYVTGDLIVTMDEDLQHRPKDIETLMVKQRSKGYDVVYGKYKILMHSGFRNLTSRIIRKSLSFAIPELYYDYSAFRLIKASIAKECIEMHNSYTFLDGYLSWVTTHVTSAEVDHQERIGGESSYTLSKLINHTINIFTTFSNLPIRFLTWMSLVIFFLSFVYSLFILYQKLVLGNLMIGYASSIIVTGFGVGLILLGLGIVGEYIHRINQKTTRRPNFVERKILGND